MSEFLKRLGEGPLLCDGAMGTLLYARGVFINRCYDELNLSQPEIVSGVHADYVKAGAEVLETNTFGANRYRLLRHGFEAKVREINRAGVKLARAAAGAGVMVAGSVGPLGQRIEPLGKISRSEAQAAFREQIEALAEEGVDLLMLETFGSIDELHEAVVAARAAAPNLPIVAEVTIDEDGHALDGTAPETFGARLTDFGVDVAGCNCSVGPAAMLDTIERLRRSTTLPLAAQPNAGMPRNVEGRNIYLCSPEYMATYARKFVAAGVSLVGGCCGTTPEHIKSMKSALRVDQARTTSFHVTVATPTPAAPPVKPLAERSRLARKLVEGEFVTMVEIVPPKGNSPAKEIAAAQYLRSVGIDAVNVPDSPRASARMSNQALCTLIEREVGVETVLHYTCRDRNVLGIQSDLLGASALGIHNLICITGDPPKMGNYPDATAVFDVDAIGLVNIVSNLNLGVDIGANSVGTATSFVIGVGANPGVENIDEEIRRFEQKVAAGAHFAVTQPVFDMHLLEQFIRRVEHCGIPILAGIWPLTSLRNAEFMRNELRVSVPDSIMERMAAVGKNSELARAEGVLIAREMLLEARSMVQGVQVSAPLGKFSAAVDVIEALGQRDRAQQSSPAQG
jgi:methionine synthase I (cobalamin-dependent)/5,10-methylenetetrahydrofolate reductase